MRLEFWETVILFVVEMHCFADLVMGHSFPVGELMRLYVQPGLSGRVLRALQVRLREAMASANDANVEGPQNLGGDHSREGDSAERTRSRSRGHGREGSEDTPKVDQIPLGTLGGEPSVPEDHRETMADEAEGLPGAPATPPKGASRYELMQEIISCGKTIAAANEDLALVMDELKDTKKDLAAGFKILGDQLTATTHAISTMSGAVSHQSSEVSKLLKAFDRHAGAIRWALKGDCTLEQSIQGVTTEITNRAGQLENRIGLAFENLSRGLQQLIQTLQDQPSAVPALGSASSRFPPPFPLSTGGTARAAAPLTPAMGAAGIPLQTEVPPPPPMEEPQLPISSFVGFMPMCAGEQGPPSSHHPNTPTPRKGTPVLTRDHVSGGQRAVSPTVYRQGQISALTSAWCPAGLATIHDGKGESRRIYQ